MPRRPTSLAPLSLLLGIAVTVVFARHAWPAAPRPTVANLIVTSNSDHLLVFARFEGLLDGELRSALRSGVPLRTVCEVEVYRERRLWPDQAVGAMSVTRTVKYDILREQYILAAPGPEATAGRVTGDPRDVESWMSVMDGVPVLPVGRLGAGRRYYLRLHAAIAPDKDPLVNNILFFRSAAGRATAWQRSPLFGFSPPR